MRFSFPVSRNSVPSANAKRRASPLTTLPGRSSAPRRVKSASILPPGNSPSVTPQPCMRQTIRAADWLHVRRRLSLWQDKCISQRCREELSHVQTPASCAGQALRQAQSRLCKTGSDKRRHPPLIGETIEPLRHSGESRNPEGCGWIGNSSREAALHPLPDLPHQGEKGVAKFSTSKRKTSKTHLMPKGAVRAYRYR